MTDLQVLLKAAKPGDTISLPPGVYGGLDLNGLTFTPAVTITSADPANRAVLTNFNTESCQGLTFKGLDFHVVAPVTCAFNVYSCSRITFDGCHAYGPSGAPTENGAGFRFFDCQTIAFVNSEIEQVATGIGFARCDHLTVAGNHIHHVNSDALDFGQVTDVTISGNALHDFYPTSGNHPDAIQFGTYGTTTPSHDITISDNLIYRGAGQNTQGVFMADDSQAGNLPFANVTVTGNLVIGTGPSAVRPTSCKGLTVSGNELLSIVGGDPTTLLVQGSDQITHGGNAAVSLSIEAKNGNTNIIAAAVDVLNGTVTQAQADARVAAWLASHTGPWSKPAPAPVPPVDPAAKYVVALQKIVSLGTAANAKRAGPTKADMTGVMTVAKAALS